MSTAAKRGTEGRRRRRRRMFSFRPWEVPLLALMAVACVTMAFGIYQRYTSAGEYRMDYEGRIVGKSLTVTETQMGSGQRLRLHIRGADGREFQIAVNPELYGRAREGMWIKSSRDGAKLTWDGPPQPPPRPAGR